jgi:hypothetical protein
MQTEHVSIEETREVNLAERKRQGSLDVSFESQRKKIWILKVKILRSTQALRKSSIEKIRRIYVWNKYDFRKLT